MKQLLTWSQIRDFFEGYWVELVDVEWNARELYPRRAAVRNQALDRQELLAMIGKHRPEPNSVVLFIGSHQACIRHEHSAAVL